MLSDLHNRPGIPAFGASFGGLDVVGLDQQARNPGLRCKFGLSNLLRYLLKKKVSKPHGYEHEQTIDLTILNSLVDAKMYRFPSWCS